MIDIYRTRNPGAPLESGGDKSSVFPAPVSEETSRIKKLEKLIKKRLWGNSRINKLEKLAEKRPRFRLDSLWTGLLPEHVESKNMSEYVIQDLLVLSILLTTYNVKIDSKFKLSMNLINLCCWVVTMLRNVKNIKLITRGSYTCFGGAQVSLQTLLEKQEHSTCLTGLFSSRRLGRSIKTNFYQRRQRKINWWQLFGWASGRAGDFLNLLREHECLQV